MVAAVRVATLALRRRRLGLVVIGLGVVSVVVGLVRNVAAAPAGSSPLPLQAVPGVAQQAVGQNTSIVALLGHSFTQAFTTDGLGKIVADFGLRAGSVMALGALLLVVFSAALGPFRGFVGAAAGLGIAGCLLIAGVIFGENARVHASGIDTSAAAAGISSGWWFCVIGFAVCVVGGALAALRPGAGLVSAVALVISGFSAALGLSLIIAADHLLSGLGGGGGGVLIP